LAQEAALKGAFAVSGVLKLKEAVVTSEGVRWLILGPVGTPLPWHPETTVLGLISELAAVIGELKKAGWMHCDISYFNCMIFPGNGAGLIDLGAARTLAQVRFSLCAQA